ncbi:MAG: AI-2E family transporter [Armatimonadota bacterium]
MQDRTITGRDLRAAILFGALVYLAIRFTSQIADILLILSVSALITAALSPIVSWLHRHRVPRQASAALLALAVIAIVGLAGYLVIPLATRQGAQLIKQGPGYGKELYRWIQKVGLDEYVPRKFDTASVKEILRPVITGASRATASVAGAVGGALLVFIITIYLLANPAPITEGILRALDPNVRASAKRAGERLTAQVRAWAVGVLIGMFLIFLLTWIALSIIGLEQAFLFAVIAGLLEAVPVLGPILSAVPPTIVALLSSNPVTALWVVIAFVIIQQFEGNVLIPLVMSRQLSLHPVTVIFSVLVMGGLFGIVGIFLAAPAAVAAGIVLDEFYFRPREEKAAGVPEAS